METKRRKVYVEVEVTHRTDGTARPNLIRFENGERYEVDRVIPVSYTHLDVYKRQVLWL